MQYTAKGVQLNINAERSGDEVDRANELADILLQHQINNGRRDVPTVSKGWVCRLPTCSDELDSKRLFCNGACATAFSLLR
jgi:hypothetical protein